MTDLLKPDGDFEERVRESFARQAVMRTIGAELTSVTPGIVEHDLTVETMAERLAEIRNEDGYQVPTSMNEEMGIAIKQLG